MTRTRLAGRYNVWSAKSDSESTTLAAVEFSIGLGALVTSPGVVQLEVW